ncbi:MAG: hypothetical protein JWM91_1101 [Rhodospirillales bacterium]|nr:hypothetical protein [Rhodospirillales bacterium]
MAQFPNRLEWIGPAPPPPCLADIAQAHGSRLDETIAFPGLINSHDHLEFNCYAPTGTPPYRDFLEWSYDVQAARDMVERIEAIDRRMRAQLGLLKNLLWGVTAVADHGGTAIPGNHAIAVLSPYKDLHSPELEHPVKWLTGLRPVVLHLAEGTTAESRRRALLFLERNLFHRPVAGVHGVSLESGDFSRLSALIWCPVSNLFLFGQTADVASATRHTAVLFGTDSTLSAPGTLWDHLRQVRDVVTDEDIFAALTARPARFWRLRRRDDFVIARRRESAKWDAFFSLTPDDILLVVRAGQPILIDTALAAAVPLSADFFPLAWGASRKYVRMPLEMIMRAIEPQLDPAALIARFAGV